MSGLRTAVVTLVHSRHQHLATQVAGLDRGTRRPDLHVVVAMDDPDVQAVVPGADVVAVPRVQGRLPLAAARNAGVARAREAGADLLVLLDVDCVPGPGALARYAEAAGDHDGVLSGPVGYLPPAPVGGYPLERLADLARAHPARPVPGDDEVLASYDPDLFWSLSFALTPSTWDRIGGFCEAYTGYGGEDTDFGYAGVAAGVPAWWVGGAWAYHQHHGPERAGPPVEHLHDLVRNAGVFHDRWGWSPMRGWFEQLAEQGLVRHDAATGRWSLA